MVKIYFRKLNAHLNSCNSRSLKRLSVNIGSFFFSLSRHQEYGGCRTPYLSYKHDFATNHVTLAIIVSSTINYSRISTIKSGSWDAKSMHSQRRGRISGKCYLRYPLSRCAFCVRFCSLNIGAHWPCTCIFGKGDTQESEDCVRIKRGPIVGLTFLH